MSIGVMSLVLKNYPVGGAELIAMLILANRANDTGVCWPSMATIANDMRVTRCQAQRVVHRLTDKGYVAVTANATGGKPGATPTYQINLGKLARGSEKDTGSKNDTGITLAEEGPRLRTERGSQKDTQNWPVPDLVDTTLS